MQSVKKKKLEGEIKVDTEIEEHEKPSYWRVGVQQEHSQTGDPARQNSSQLIFYMIQIQLLPHLQRISSAAWESRWCGG